MKDAKTQRERLIIRLTRVYQTPRRANNYDGNQSTSDCSTDDSWIILISQTVP